MNTQDLDVLNTLMSGGRMNQRMIAEESGYSLGAVNRSVRWLKQNGLLNDNGSPTAEAVSLSEERKPKNAIILAAGYGMRMIPINTEKPKGLLEVNGEPLIERTIKQLHDAGVDNIYLVVGFMKEWYEYLTDKFGVHLISNHDYATKNNLHSLALAADLIGNSYIVPCDIWCSENPFKRRELYSWYMVGDWQNPDSTVKVNRKRNLVPCVPGEDGNAMIGICYVQGETAAGLCQQLRILDNDKRYSRQFWESALFDKISPTIAAKTVSASDAIEINTYEQLRELDNNSSNLKTESLECICRVLNTGIEEIKQIDVLKKGMTNRSFLFSCRGKKYIMRIPGEGTDRLVNRRQEADVYRALDGHELCDKVLYIDAQTGYKISEFIEGARVCNPLDSEDVKKCMSHLRRLHDMGLHVDHEFDLFQQIEFYESLREGRNSVYRDYKKTKEKVMALKDYIDRQQKKYCLAHVDAVPDNFIIYSDSEGKERLCLIDWEYSGMQDAHVDIAMFGIYSMYSKEQMDNLISEYFVDGCDEDTRYKIYAYVSVCGLLWSNWCEYKMDMGVDFGDYSISQYAYAREYAKLVQRMINQKEGGRDA